MSMNKNPLHVVDSLTQAKYYYILYASVHDNNMLPLCVCHKLRNIKKEPNNLKREGYGIRT